MAKSNAKPLNLKRIIKTYQDRLNDISRRNRSLRLSRIVKRKTFDFADLNKLSGNKAFKAVESIVLNNRGVNIVNINPSSDEEDKILKDIMYLKREIDFILKEKGCYECYLGYPFIHGNFQDGTYFRCPLFLFPVSIGINRQTQKLFFEPIKDEEPIANKTFFLASNKYNSSYTRFEMDKLDEVEDLERKDLISWAIKLFKDLNYKAQTDDFHSDQIVPLISLKKEQIPENMKGEINFLNLAVIGDFSQMNTALNNDYSAMSEDNMNNMSKMLLGEIEETNSEEKIDDEIKKDYPEIENYFITQPDISQEQVLVKSRSGQGLVIHGPPGTGKSQVITNFIAENLLLGNKILLVCEKRAALDVVYNRLASKGLQKYSLLVHDAQSGRNEIFQKLNSILTTYDNEEYNKSSKFEDAFDIHAKKIDTRVNELRDLINFVHEKSKYGISLFHMYMNSDLNITPHLDLSPKNFENVTKEEMGKAIETLKIVADLTYIYDNPNYPLYFREPFSTSFDEQEFKKDLEELFNIFMELEKEFYCKEVKQDLLHVNLSRERIQNLLNVIDSLKYIYFTSKKWTKFMNIKYFTYNMHFSILLNYRDRNCIFKTWSNLERILVKLDKKIKYMERYFQKNYLDSFIKNIFQFKNNSNKIRDILSCLKDIDKIIVLDKVKGQMTNLEKNLFALCLRDIPPSKSNIAQKWEEIIRNSFYIHWIQKLELSMPNLKGFTSIEHDNIKSEMITLLRQKMDLVPKIIEQLFRSKYHTIKWNGFDGDGRRKNYNALNSFIHEVSKQRKRISVRQLVENFSNKGLFDLFPCWMCSPETVSNIFPLKASFDIVIFDEASQCKIERAIPSVMRGKRIIVAGDEKQLPPSNFFVTNVDDEAEDDEDLSIEDQQILESESLLIRAKSFLPGKRLNYHYRSNHHELIDFSNYAFYQSMLRVIPSNRIKTDSPIEFIKCKGIWRDRKNEDEAKQLVLLLKKLLKNNSKGQTFGIITFNSSQKEEIENRIDEETKKDPYFATLIDAEQNRYNKDEYIGLFVKNIENVQGDERDVIIFSISYANDDAGKFRYRFGPLNGPYGSNRLNVAISRAKEKIYLFCSFNPIDFKYEGSYDGPKLLGKYLSYCKAISDNNTKQAESILKSLLVSDSGAQTSLNYFDSDFEAEVAEELEKIGFEIKTQVGCNGYKIDIAIVNPKDKNKYLCGIECDGETYHSIRSVKDRDLYRQSVLEANGWKIIRVLSRDWWKDQDKEVKRIHREILSLIDSYKKDAPLKNNRVNTVTEKKKKLENLV